MSLSIRDQLALLDAQERADYINTLDPDQLQLLVDGDWSVVGRPEQFLPTLLDWFLWFVRAGRGWGKTKTGSEGTKELILQLTPLVPDGKVRWALGAPRHPDVLNIMLEGETGLQSVLPPSLLIGGSWERSITRGAVPELHLSTGAIIQGYSATVPGGPRGPQFHGAWCDEPGTYPDAHLGLDDDTFMSNLLFGLRLPPTPRLIVTGTPRNNRLIKELQKFDGVVETHGRTTDNVHNLADAFKRNIVARYAGTRLGRQELDAEVLEGVGAIFQRGWFRIVKEPPWPHGTETRTVRYWDLASAEESDANPDPDYTAGALVTMDPRRRLYFIEDITRFRKGPGARELAIGSQARQDGLQVLWIEQERGNAGKTQVHFLGRELDPYNVNVKGDPVSGPKAVRWELLSGPAEQGRVYLQEADWNLAFLDEAEEAHPDPLLSGPHDDQLDAIAGAIKVLKGGAGAQAVGKPDGMASIPKPVARGQGMGAGTSPVPGRIDRGSSLSRRR